MTMLDKLIEGMEDSNSGVRLVGSLKLPIDESRFRTDLINSPLTGPVVLETNLVLAPAKPVYEADRLQEWMMRRIPKLGYLSPPLNSYHGGPSRGFIQELSGAKEREQNVFVYRFWQGKSHLHVGRLELVEIMAEMEKVGGEVAIKPVGNYSFSSIISRLPTLGEGGLRELKGDEPITGRSFDLEGRLVLRPFPDEVIAKGAVAHMKSYESYSSSYLEVTQIPLSDIRNRQGGGSLKRILNAVGMFASRDLS